MLELFDYTTYQFADAWVLWLLLIIPAFWVYYFYFKYNRSTPVSVSSMALTNGYEKSKISIQTLQFISRTLGLLFLIIALARPQLKLDSTTQIEQFTEGIDIIISLDASGSMEAEDFQPNRFDAAKSVAQEFIAKRTNDRIGLVVFEGEAYTQCPLTSDKKVLSDIIGETKRGIVNGGTAIGMGLATAVNRLRESDAKSKIIILLTDGVNTHGKIHPMNAAEDAKAFDIRVYTIGVGTNGKAKTPVAINPITNEYIYDYVDVEIDEPLLKEISAMTGGSYFRATDNESLKAIYDEIDELEKHLIKTTTLDVDLPEKSMPFIVIGILFLSIEFLLRLLFKTVS